MPIDLYLSVHSPASRTVLSVAKHLDLELNLKSLDLYSGEQLNPEFLKLNPAHLVPTIDDNGFVLWESRAIIQYLCNKYAPDSDLYPQDPKRRALVDRVLNFDIGTLYTALREGFMVKFLTGVDPPQEKVDALNNSLKYLDLFIGDNKYVAGNHLTIADLSILSSAILFLLFVEYDLSAFPNFSEWLERLQTELSYFDEIHGKTIREAPALFDKMRENAQKSQKNN